MKKDSQKKPLSEKKKQKKEIDLLEKERFANYKRLIEAEKIRVQNQLTPPKNKETILSLQHVNKIYTNGYVQAVYDFNLDINKGDFVVLVGPSGCGKSTTLRMIAGLEDITTGDLFINGQYGNNLEPKNRNMAMVFQSYALYPHLTVYDNMAFSLKLRHFPKEEILERGKKAAVVLELEKYLDRKPKELSGGQRQRVALGRAIVRNADIFLMDEPLSNLDAKLRVQMRSEIVKLHNKLGATTIYVTHDQTEAMSMASKLVVMKDGKVQQIGTPSEIYYHPANCFVATFIGSPSMNLINTTIKNGEFTLKDASFKLSKEQCSNIDKFYDHIKKEVLLKIKEEKDNLTSDIMKNPKIENKDEAIKNIGSFKLKDLESELHKIEEIIQNKEKEIIIGVRPEDMEVVSKKTDTSLSTCVDIFEMMGKESFVYFHIDKNNIVAKANSKGNFEVGKNIFVDIPKESLYFFDPLTNRRIDL